MEPEMQGDGAASKNENHSRMEPADGPALPGPQYRLAVLPHLDAHLLDGSTGSLSPPVQTAPPEPAAQLRGRSRLISRARPNITTCTSTTIGPEG